MSGSKGSGVSNPWILFCLNLEQARELGRGNAIHQLQQNYQALSAEVTQMSTGLREILAHLREDLGGGRRRAPITPRDESPSYHSSSSQEECVLGQKQGHKQPINDLRDVKIDPPEFEGNLNPDLFIDWM